MKKMKPGKPRAGEESKTLTAQKPWVKLGMSRATWYRANKPTKKAKKK